MAGISIILTLDPALGIAKQLGQGLLQFANRRGGIRLRFVVGETLASLRGDVQPFPQGRIVLGVAWRDLHPPERFAVDALAGSVRVRGVKIGDSQFYGTNHDVGNIHPRSRKLQRRLTTKSVRHNPAARPAQRPAVEM